MSTHEDNTTALAICILARKPVIIWGNPGQGKTSIIEALCMHYGMHLETVIASTFEPADFGGLPIVDTLTGTYTRAAPGWAKRATDHASTRGSVIFYDELSTAPPAVQAGALRPILSNWVGDHYMGDNVMSIAAANPASVAADGWDLAPPMANRFVHLDWALDADTIRQGFTVGWPEVKFPAVNEERLAIIRRETRIALGVFLNMKSDLIDGMPTASAEESGRAWPSPRSWEVAADLYSYAKAANVSSTVAALLVNGSVGVGAGHQFTTYLDNLDLPDPEVLLADPDKFVVPSERSDKVFGISASVWAAVERNNTPARWQACGKILGKVADAGHADVAFIYGRYWARNRPEGAMPDPSVYPSLLPILSELGKFV
jgi:hypothetical protein